ncbi:hypothetical protein EV424DRAFT_1347748 [Suillus variegatus]|nr:hypothetical protein EV424DRAFT_1347748 [Suillus variegatus]
MTQSPSPSSQTDTMVSIRLDGLISILQGLCLDDRTAISVTLQAGTSPNVAEGPVANITGPAPDDFPAIIAAHSPTSTTAVCGLAQPSLLILARQIYEVRSAGNKSEGIITSPMSKTSGPMFSGFGLAGFVGFRRISVGFVANVGDSERRVTVVGIDTTEQDIGRTNARENIGSEAADARERRVCIGFASGLADKRRIEWLSTSSSATSPRGFRY